MKFTIINSSGQYLDNESFYGLKDLNSELKWLEKDFVEDVVVEGVLHTIDRRVCFSIDFKGEKSPEVVNKLILLEEILGTNNFDCIPHIGYQSQLIQQGNGLWLVDKNLSTGEESVVFCWKLSWDTTEEPEDDTTGYWEAEV